MRADLRRQDHSETLDAARRAQNVGLECDDDDKDEDEEDEDEEEEEGGEEEEELGVLQE